MESPDVDERGLLSVINRVVLVGRLTDNADFRYTRDGLPISAFCLSTGRQGSCDFLPVVMFRRLAETTSKYLQKGRLVGVEGRISTRSFETTDGEKRRVIEVIADRLRFLDPPLVIGEEGETPPDAPSKG
jgi:single-strand DNA-binding protein